MVTDNQVRRLRKLSNTGKNQEIAASKVGMDPKTARKHLALDRLPSEVIKVRHRQTREDPGARTHGTRHGGDEIMLLSPTPIQGPVRHRPLGRCEQSLS
jgi:hypothetical protein